MKSIKKNVLTGTLMLFAVLSSSELVSQGANNYQAYFNDGCFWICTSMAGTNCSSASEFDDLCG